MSKNLRYAILGYPVSHSLSPLFYNTAFRLAHLDSVYERLEIRPGTLETLFRSEMLKDFAGFNVTVPHKVDVMHYLTDLSNDASSLGAVNTIIIEGDRVQGHNTDVVGVERSLADVAEEVSGHEVCLFGAGGVARAVVRALDRAIHPSRLTVVNRDHERLKVFLRSLSPSSGFQMEGMGPEDPGLPGRVDAARLVIQATSVGMHPNVEDCILRETNILHDDQIIFDLVYTPLQTRLLREASKRGARTIGGLRMFLIQAAASFEIFTGRMVDLKQVSPIIEAELMKRTANGHA